MQTLGIVDSDRFTADIEILRKSSENYLEAITRYCEQHNIEISTVTKLISPQIISKLTMEAYKLHLITQPENYGINF